MNTVTIYFIAFIPNNKIVQCGCRHMYVEVVRYFTPPQCFPADIADFLRIFNPKRHLTIWYFYEI